MSTRKLIIASLICGLLILGAGTLKLLQTANDGSTAPSVLALGESGTIGEVSMSVNEISVVNERTLVNVTMSGLAEESPVDVGDCPATAKQATCTMEFVVAVGTPTIVYARDGEKRQWLGS